MLGPVALQRLSFGAFVNTCRVPSIFCTAAVASELEARIVLADRPATIRVGFAVR
jgi:hypothetical protein